MPKYNFHKLLDARMKAHIKSQSLFDKGMSIEANKLNKKVNQLSELISDEIPKL